jgi:hypothetical protein
VSKLAAGPEKGHAMLRRAAYGYAGAAGTFLLLVLLLPDSFYDAPAIIGPALGFMAGVGLADHRRAFPPRILLVRTSLGVVAYFGAGIAAAVASAAGEKTFGPWLSAFLALPRDEWVPLMLLPLAGPLLGSLASEFVAPNRLGWLAWLVEVAACGVGLVAALWLAGQAAAVFCFVTLGPLSAIGSRISSAAGALVGPLGAPSYPTLSVFGLSTILGAGFVVVRVGQRFSSRIGIIVIEIALAVVLLGTSFRLTALLAVVAALGLERVAHSGSRGRILRWVAAPVIVILSLAPVDVSFQSLPGPPHFAPAIQGLLTRSVTDIARHGPSVVVGGCSSFYFAPRWVWVW